MLHWMRSSFQQHKDISYIFLGSKQSLMEEIFTSQKSPFYEFASVVFDLVNAGIKQEAEDFVSRWLKKIILPQTDVFQDIFDQLTNSQRAALQAIAHAGGEGIYSEALRLRYDLPVSSSLNEVLKALQKKGLIFKSFGIYKITNPVLKAWLLDLG